MTSADLHEAVAAMTEAGRGLVEPTEIKVGESMNPFELHAFLMTSPCVQRVDTPDQFASKTGKGIVVVRRGSVSYTDGI